MRVHGASRFLSSSFLRDASTIYRKCSSCQVESAGIRAGMAETAEAPQLQKGLRQRHMTMISLGGVIGAGLFVGSGAVMNQTGPSAILSYLAAGLLVVLVMRMLGEMAVANPRVGSFMEYTPRGARAAAASPSAGSTGTSGRSCSPSRRSPARRSSQNWLPGIPIWVMSLVLMTALTADEPVVRAERSASSSSGSRRSRSPRSSSSSRSASATCSASAAATRPGSPT